MSKLPDPCDPREVEPVAPSDEVASYEQRVERAALALLRIYYLRRPAVDPRHDQLIRTIAQEYELSEDDIASADILGIARRRA